MRLNESELIKNQAEVRRAEQARAILDNPLWAETKAQVDAKIMAELTRAAINDHAQLVHLKLFKQAMEAFEVSLNHTANTGKLADAALRQHHSMIEKFKQGADRVMKRRT